MEGLVEALFNGGNRTSQIEAATEITGLKTKQRHELADRGVIGPLIGMLVRSLHWEDDEAIKASLSALLALVFGSERNKVRMVKMGAVPALLKLLHSRSEAVVELSAVAILILSSCAANRVAIVSSGAIQTLVSLIDDESHGARVKLDAVATLQNLSTLGQTMPLVLASGGVSSLAKLLISTDKSSEVAEKVTALLEMTAVSSSDALVEVACDGGIVHALVEVMEEGTAQGREHAVAILLLMCRTGRERYRESIIRAGAVPGLLQLSADRNRRARRMGQQLLALLRDRDCSSLADVGSKKHATKPEFVERIMREIDGEGEMVVGATLRMVEEMVAKLRSEETNWVK